MWTGKSGKGKSCGHLEKFQGTPTQDGNRSPARAGLASAPASKLKKKRESRARLPARPKHTHTHTDTPHHTTIPPPPPKQHNNQNSEGGGMSDVTEPGSEADKGWAPLPLGPAQPQGGALPPIAGERSPRTRNFSSLRKKSCAPLRVVLFFFRLLSSSPPPPSSF